MNESEMSLSFLLLQKPQKFSSLWVCSSYYPVVVLVKVSISSFISSIMLPLCTVEKLCVAVSVGLGLDKGSLSSKTNWGKFG